MTTRMSTRYNNGSHYENHQRAAELEKLPEHEHRVAAALGHSVHLAEPAAEHPRESRSRPLDTGSPPSAMKILPGSRANSGKAAGGQRDLRMRIGSAP